MQEVAPTADLIGIEGEIGAEVLQLAERRPVVEAATQFASNAKAVLAPPTSAAAGRLVALRGNVEAILRALQEHEEATFAMIDRHAEYIGMAMEFEKRVSPWMADLAARIAPGK